MNRVKKKEYCFTGRIGESCVSFRSRKPSIR